MLCYEHVCPCKKLQMKTGLDNSIIQDQNQNWPLKWLQKEDKTVQNAQLSFKVQAIAKIETLVVVFLSLKDDIDRMALPEGNLSLAL